MVKNLQFKETEYRNLKSHSLSPGGYWIFLEHREKPATDDSNSRPGANGLVVPHGLTTPSALCRW